MLRGLREEDMRLIISILLAGALLTGVAGAAEKTFNGPKYRNVARIDHCLSDAGACGQPAADLFCQGQGFLRAKKFSVSASTAATVYYGTFTQCNRRQCVPFDRIACTDAPNFEATSETDIGSVKP
jgi:hypothetical protein